MSAMRILIWVLAVEHAPKFAAKTGPPLTMEIVMSSSGLANTSK